MLPPEAPTGKRSAIALAALIVLSALTVVPMGVVAQNADPNEPNDNRSDATPIEGGQINGTLSNGNDSDWYSFQANEGETVTLLFTKPVNDETGIFAKLYQPDSEDYDLATLPVGEDTRSQITFVPARTGTHYIKVDAKYGGADEPASYSISLPDAGLLQDASTSSSGVPQETEPNDDGSAGTLIEDTQIKGEIAARGDADWYVINATADENVSVQLTKPAPKSVLRMELLAPNGTELVNDTVFEGDDTAQISAIANRTGSYFLYVGSDYESSNIPYTLYTPASAAQSATTVETETTTGTQAEPSTSTSTQSTVTGNTSIEYPSGYSASGIADPSRAANQYASALSEFSSYSATRNFTSIFQDDVSYINNTFRVDVANERAYTYENLSGGGNPIVEETYRTADVVYTRTASSMTNGSQYKAQSQPFSVTYNSTVPSVERYLRSANYGPAQTVERNGETLIRYEATEVVSPDAFLVPSNDTSDVSAFNATLLVDQNGVLRTFSYFVEFEGDDGNQVTKQSTLRLSGFNATSVDEPGWLGEAKASLGGGSTNTTVTEGTSTDGGTSTAGTPIETTTTETATTVAMSSQPTTQATEATSTPTESDGGSIATTNTSGGNESGGSSTFGPGFGPVVTMVAILAAGLLAVRYRQRGSE